MSSRNMINEGNLWILDADLRSYFDKIDQERLVQLIAEEISDGRVLHLIRSFLESGVIIDGAWPCRSQLITYDPRDRAAP
jgi:retron-type reverse transcriptase